MALQISGSLLEGCVLAVLCQGDEYGYSLTHRLKTALGVSESTLYPVMRRLQNNDCLTVYDVAHNGRNRRYYRITERGRATKTLCTHEWQDYKNRIDEILNESFINESNNGGAPYEN
jgi:PadR family transcriptional regulator PadR